MTWHDLGILSSRFNITRWQFTRYVNLCSAGGGGRGHIHTHNRCCYSSGVSLSPISLMMLSLNVVDFGHDVFLNFNWINKNKESRNRPCAISEADLSKWETSEFNPYIFIAFGKGTPSCLWLQTPRRPTWLKPNMPLSYQVRLCLRSFFRFRAPWRSLVIIVPKLD